LLPEGPVSTSFSWLSPNCSANEVRAAERLYRVSKKYREKGIVKESIAAMPEHGTHRTMSRIKGPVMYGGRINPVLTLAGKTRRGAITRLRENN